MIWLCLGVILGLIVALVRLRQKWVLPWQRVEQMMACISRGEKPRTFLLEGAAGPRKVALALEHLFERQTQLDRRIAENTSGADTVFAALQDGLLVVDTGHRLTFLNRSFKTIFGVGPDHLGRPLLEVIRDPMLDRLVGQTLSLGDPQGGELAVTLPSEQPRWLQVSAVTVKNETGLTTGAVVLFHDITQLKQTDQIRRDFVANVSHELRTPLSILRGYLETLLDDPNTSRAELVRILEVMNRHSNRLGLLVDDLLILAQLESTNPNLQLSEVPMTELLADMAGDWEKKFLEKELTLEVKSFPDNLLLRADETRLQEILYNLLDNALKYTAPGGKVYLEAEGRGEEVVVRVSDTGVGIPAADLPRIFERFYRADKARSREIGGTGLGLSIVKHIAQMHGGRVEAESILRQGSTIRVILPIQGPTVPFVTESSH